MGDGGQVDTQVRRVKPSMEVGTGMQVRELCCLEASGNLDSRGDI